MWIIPIILGLILVYSVSWFTGDKEYSGVKTGDDEHSQLKMKSIVGSWIFLLMILFVRFVIDLLNLNPSTVTFKFPELLYLILLVGSYFVHYYVYSRRLSSNEK
ncbi:hypothetical protein [Pseudogracilibacillus auburnensis]|uniref:hypothetical protein n=1 Tax=Pseudogracilibacillus auburnensis TaxID=1494959 RepID=UPI0027D9FCE3|nr:hypothetical protein [Pseudogracilibacillus auburnensis]